MVGVQCANRCGDMPGASPKRHSDWSGGQPAQGNWSTEAPCEGRGSSAELEDLGQPEGDQGNVWVDLPNCPGSLEPQES